MSNEKEQVEYIGIIETNEGDIYIEKHNFVNSYSLVAGTSCNVGMLVSDSIKGDECFSFDENLSNFVEDLLNKYGEYEE